ncbi:MAG: phenylalanine--tRNA ligase subunit beta [Gammaproteobacteria bacterium]|nr:MAG: phenylalanine--tRNA ligase subunit beta [Gammaproteobacteria bacterium]
MKFSETWLREWVNPDISTEELAEQLTMAGLEVEAIKPVAAEFDGVVLAKIIAADPHPDADKLQVCQVQAGDKDPLQIVCGASNARVGIVVPLATVGASLAEGIKIKRAKLRGVESLGMLCSAKELGLAESADGLYEFPHDAPLGKDVREYLQLDDNSIELSLTPNRSDCLGVAGIAREVGVLNCCELTQPVIDEVPNEVEDVISVSIEAPEDCPHYVGRVMLGVNADASTPQWMQEKLRRSGLRSLGAIIDVTNYVLLELGQPMHAFELNKLNGGIHVRHAKDNEQLRLLDGQQLTLEVGTLVIADDKQVQALAGIMGGEDSAVSSGQQDIFLESAYFEPSTIAGRARRYGLHTDSSHRFERGVDPQLQRQAIERATKLLTDIAGGKPGPVIEVTHAAHLPKRSEINLRAERIRRVLGLEIPDDVVTDCLHRLGMSVSEHDADGIWQVTPPSFRFDIALEVDLIEEIGRIYGYNQLPTHPPQGDLSMAPQPEGKLGMRRLRSLLVDRGYTEIVTYSFVDSVVQQQVSSLQGIALANPLSQDMAEMRTSLLPGLLQAAMHNQHRQQERLKIFELGIRYIMQDIEINEINVIGGLIYGAVLPQQWGSEPRGADFYDIKVDVEAILGLTGRSEEFSFIPTQHMALHPGQGADIIYAGQVIGWLGALHPLIHKKQGFNDDVYVFEIDTAGLDKVRIPACQKLSRFPSIRRDLAIVVDEEITSQAVYDCVTKASGGLLRNLQLFDVYTGKGVDLGKKSLALALILRGSSRTLNEEDINTVMGRVIASLQQELNAILRE